MLEHQLRSAEKELRKWQAQAEDLTGALAEREQEQEEQAELQKVVADLMAAIEKYKTELDDAHREVEVGRSTQTDLSHMKQALEKELERLRSAFVVVQDERAKEKQTMRQLRVALDSSEHEIRTLELAVCALRDACEAASARADQVEGELAVLVKDMTALVTEKEWLQEAVRVQAYDHRVEREGLAQDQVQAVQELEGFVAELELELQKEADASGISDLEEQVRRLRLDLEAEREARARDRKKMAEEHKQNMLHAAEESKGLRAKVEGLLAAFELERERREKVEQRLAETSSSLRTDQAPPRNTSLTTHRSHKSAAPSRKVGVKKKHLCPEVDVADCNNVRNNGGNLDPLDSSTDLESSCECRTPTEHVFHASPFFCDDELAVAGMLRKGQAHARRERDAARQGGRSHSHSPPPSPSKLSTAVRRTSVELGGGVFDVVATNDDRRYEDDERTVSVSQSVSFPLPRAHRSTAHESKRSWKASVAKKKRVLVLPQNGREPYSETLRSRTPDLQSATI